MYTTHSRSGGLHFPFGVIFFAVLPAKLPSSLEMSGDSCAVEWSIPVTIITVNYYCA